MILEFSVGNYRSINKLQTLSFRATKLKSHQNQNTIETSEGHLLKGGVIYGANGSGKSNLISALYAMAKFVGNSMKDETAVDTIYEPFKRFDANSALPSYFQIVFLLDDRKYRYGFEVNAGEVQSEWLFGPGEKNQIKYFTRNSDGVSVGSKEFFKEGEGIDFQYNLRKENLALNLIFANKGEICEKIKRRVFERIEVDKSDNKIRFRRNTINVLKENKKVDVLDWMEEIDADWRDIYIESNALRPAAIERVHITKEKYDSNGIFSGFADFDLSLNESAGTNKFFNYRAIIQLCFDKGGFFIADEIDAHLHPLLVRRIIEMFHNPDINRGRAQYFFATHDTNLLDPGLLRRDQIFFAEKIEKGETAIYALSDLKGVREEESFSKNYIQGKYGAIPYFGDLKIFESIEDD